MHMPAAKGLFHRVSAQSGSANYRNTDPAASIKAQQAVAAEMSADVEENVDLVAANSLGQRLVGRLLRIDTATRGGDESLGYIVLLRCVVIAIDLA